MKRKRYLALTLIFVLIISVFVGCGSSAKDQSETAEAPSESQSITAPSTAGIGNYGSAGGEMADTANKADSGTASNGAKSLPKDAKLIVRADLSLETTEFLKAQAAIEALVNRYGGYFERSSTSSGSYYSENTIRNASYTIRVPKDKYRKFLDEIGNTCHQVDKSESAEDVGEAYFDTEIRLKTLKTKQERLLILLGKAQKMEDIISLENALSDVQYQIDQLSSELKRYDNLIDYATINAELQEVIKLSDVNKNQKSFFPRLKKAITGGFEMAGEAIQELIITFAYSLPIILLAAIIGLAATLFIRKKQKAMKNKLFPPKDEKENNKDDESK